MRTVQAPSAFLKSVAGTVIADFVSAVHTSIIQTIQTSCSLKAECNNSFLDAWRAHFSQASLECCCHQWCMRSQKHTYAVDVRENDLNLTRQSKRYRNVLSSFSSFFAGFRSLCHSWRIIKNIITNQLTDLTAATHHWSLLLHSEWLTASGCCQEFSMPKQKLPQQKKRNQVSCSWKLK